MNVSHHGTPCWYELATRDLDAARRFYSEVIGWTVEDSGMPGMDYRLAMAGESRVAGMMACPDKDATPSWTVYVAVDDCDGTVNAITEAGGRTCHGPEDIPNVGRFAVTSDPHGVVFALLEPLAGRQGGAFDQKKHGHGNWHELWTPDPGAALEFYGRIFGWTESQRMDMGSMGFYHLLNHQGTDIGGMARKTPEMPRSHWLPYFGADGVDAAIGRITANGGTVLHGPAEVPGGAFIVQASDPQGACFALVGPK